MGLVMVMEECISGYTPEMRSWETSTTPGTWQAPVLPHSGPAPILAWPRGLERRSLACGEGAGGFILSETRA